MNKLGIRPWHCSMLMLFITAVVCSTAIRIEWYNHAVGGFLPRPQPPSVEGNDIKWRVTSADMAEQTYRRGIAYERGLELNSEELAGLQLDDGQKAELKHIRRQTVLKAQFRSLVGSMGCLQYLLVPIGIFISLAASRVKSVRLRSVGIACLVLNLVAGGMMLYRGYAQAMGW